MYPPNRSAIGSPLKLSPSRLRCLGSARAASLRLACFARLASVGSLSRITHSPHTLSSLRSSRGCIPPIAPRLGPPLSFRPRGFAAWARRGPPPFDSRASHAWLRSALYRELHTLLTHSPRFARRGDVSPQSLRDWVPP